jgi:hypothetical protein
MGGIGSVALGVLFALGSGCTTTVAISPSPASAPPEAGRFPHEILDGLLLRVVDPAGRVDYATLRRPTARAELERYLAALGETSPHQDPEAFPSRESRLAYWLNAYNACVLYGVIDRPELRSVKEVEKSFFYFTRYKLGDEELSLYAIENEVLRRMGEPRVHMVMNCAALGCPEMSDEALVPERLEEQLSMASARFCANPSKLRIDLTGQVAMSPIFEWYAADFDEAGGGLGFCRRFGRDDLPAQAAVSYLPWDWSLNAQPPR